MGLCIFAETNMLKYILCKLLHHFFSVSSIGCFFFYSVCEALSQFWLLRLSSLHLFLCVAAQTPIRIRMWDFCPHLYLFKLLLPPAFSRFAIHTDEGRISYSKNAAVYWQGAATFSTGAERCSALTIAWLKVTENDNCRDEAEAVIFGGEPTKKAVPIPFTKELSSRQMTRVTGFHFPFLPRCCSADLFQHLKVCCGSEEPLQESVFNVWDASDSLSHTWRRLCFI